MEGANGQLVPYLGYVDLSITFPKEFASKEIEVPTLALVVPDQSTETQPQVLIGTNTLDVLYMTLNKKVVKGCNSSFYGYKAFFKNTPSDHGYSRTSHLFHLAWGTIGKALFDEHS